MGPRAVNTRDRYTASSAKSARSENSNNALVPVNSNSSIAPSTHSHSSAGSATEEAGTHITNLLFKPNMIPTVSDNGEEGYKVYRYPGVHLMLPSGKGGDITMPYGIASFAPGMEERDASVQRYVWSKISQQGEYKKWTTDRLTDFAADLQASMPRVRFWIDEGFKNKPESLCEEGCTRVGEGGYMKHPPSRAREICVVRPDGSTLPSVCPERMKAVMSCKDVPCVQCVGGDKGTHTAK